MAVRDSACVVVLVEEFENWLFSRNSNWDQSVGQGADQSASYPSASASPWRSASDVKIVSKLWSKYDFITLQNLFTTAAVSMEQSRTTCNDTMSKTEYDTS